MVTTADSYRISPGSVFVGRKRRTTKNTVKPALIWQLSG